ncbi:MAG TPA: prepilin-type N-terminal cleavage/methylation domain-containing protein [Candidatus Paceibacterota bacterium]|nr:prepilin-type N-terminal cleavage/methylation domain-containing protein [Candidatus Paceibacterota bacterium]
MKRGFTLVEMLIAIGLFTIIVVSLIAILTVVVQVQVRSSSAAAVDQESQFLLQKLQYYIGTASIVDIVTSTPTSTLKLQVASSSLDPTYITLASGTVYLQQASGTLQALTSNRVTVSNLSFTRQSNPPGHDLVSISYAMSYNTVNVKQAFSQLFQTAIEHVSAATFDTGVYPSVNGSEPLGASGQAWSSINGTIDFSGSNVGIGTLSPGQALEVNGGIRLNPSGSEPACNSSSSARGTLWFQAGGGGKDSLYLCAQNSGGTLGWQQIY